MKNKKILSLLLSTIMLVGSMPALVLASGDEGADGQAAADQNVDEPDENDAGENDAEENEDPGYLGEVTEEESFSLGQIEAYGTRTLTFTPSRTGRYGILCAKGHELSVTVSDESGTEISFMKEIHMPRYEIKEMDLKKDETYTFTIQADSYSTTASDDAYFYITPVYDMIPYGESNILFQGGGTYTDYYFIPEESGKYCFDYSEMSGENVNVYFSNGNSVNSIISDGKLYAELEADVQYKITIYCGGKAYLGYVMHIHAYKDEQSLKSGENLIQIEGGRKEALFPFTPDTSGVYVFETKGECDTYASLSGDSGFDSSDDEGERNNFRLAQYLTKGETYFLQVRQKGSEQVTVPLYIEPAHQVLTEQEYSFDALPYDQYYYAVTPTEDGWYYLDAGNAIHTTSAYVQTGESVGVFNDAWYMSSGKTYYIRYNYSVGSADEVKFTIHHLSDELEVDIPTALTARSGDKYGHYITFTPESDGMYLFTSDIPTYFFYISQPDRQFDSGSQNDNNLSHCTALSAGTPYLIYIRMNSILETDYVATVQRYEEPVQAGKRYDVDFPKGTTKQYSFTPSESGYYMAYHEGLSDLYVQHGSEYLYGIFYNYGSSVVYKLLELQGGRTYGIKVSHYKDNLDGLNWGIMPVEALEVGEDIPVSALGGYAFYTFTPAEDGVYTFTSDMLKDANDTTTCIYTREQNNNKEVVSCRNTLIRNSLSSVLEKGKTYLIKIELKTKADTTSTMNVVKEQELELGENNVPIIDRNSRSINQLNGICSFTPKEDGLYSFVSREVENGDARITVYDSTWKKIKDIGSSYPNKYFDAEILMEAGKTYYINFWDYRGYELPVEVKKIELMEAKLEGYSLSLDGTIAINLYMTLNERVVKSDTAVLQYTRADGTVVSYDMSQAKEKELNGKTYYVFHLPVAAKEMTAKLKAQIVDPDSEFKGEVYTLTVKEYAEYIMSHAKSEINGEIVNQEFNDALPMVYALLNYGAAAQKYFGMGYEDEPANKNLSYDQQRLGNVPTSLMPKYDSESTKLPDGVTFGGASLSLESETTLTFYFSNPSGVKLSFYDGKGARISSGTSGEYTTVRVKNIPAHKLSDYVTLSIKAEGDSGEYSITYNPMTYCYNVLTRPLSATRTQDLKDLMKAFYFYNQAAVRYMASKGEA